MKIGLQTWGSDGDILPFIALANGLSSVGHEVTVAYTSVDNKDYSHMGKSMNINFIRAYDKFDSETENIFTDITKTKDALKEFILILEKYFDPAVEEMYAASKKLCIENDLVVGHIINHTLLTAAQKHNCPRVSLALCPLAIRTKYASPVGPNFGKILNSLLWRFGDYMTPKKCFKSAAMIRCREGLPPIKSLQKELYISKELTLIATSKELCVHQLDWEQNIKVCGALNLPENGTQQEIPLALSEFIDAGDPPLYFTFGSCTQFDLEGTTRLFVDAIKLLGKRSIVQSDWDNLSDVNEDPNIYQAHKIPHDRVFPHCSIVIHHGGAGTTQTTLIAGKPSVIVAHAFDQPYWGKKLQRLGCAGKLLHRRSVTPKILAQGIRSVLNSPQMKSNAASLGQRMEAENGVKSAVEMIQKRFNKNG